METSKTDIKTKYLCLVLILVLQSFTLISVAQIAIDKHLYEYDPLKWLFIGCENDHPKSWTFMGGGLCPGQQTTPIQYTVTIGDKSYFPDEFAFDRKLKIKWYLRDGFLPCPVSEWQAGPLMIEIQHFANRILNDKLTAVFSRVTIKNKSKSSQNVRLNVNALPETEIPLTVAPTGILNKTMYFDIPVNAGDSVSRDFLTIASGEMVDILNYNKIINPGFETNPLPTNNPTGWDISGDTSAIFTTGWNAPGYDYSNYMQIQSQHSGRFQLVVRKTGTYKAVISQTVSNLSKGKHSFQAWVRSSGGQKKCIMYAKNYGGPTIVTAIAGDCFHQLTIPDINVTSGKCEIGFVSEGDERNFLFIEDVAFFNTSGYLSEVSKALKLNFDSYYSEMAGKYGKMLSEVTHPVVLPVKGLADMYKSIQVMIWELIVKSGNDIEMRSGTKATFPSWIYSYDRTFTHDVPNFADQLMREGDFNRGLGIIQSSYYKVYNDTVWETKYVDLIGKYMLPYAEYLRGTGNKPYFTSEIMDELKRAARNIHKCRVFNDPKHYGLMKKGIDFENFAAGGDYLLSDNWSALHGLQAYKYICEVVGNTEEMKWVSSEIADLNTCLNTAIDKLIAKQKTDYYLGCFDSLTIDIYPTSYASWVPYSAALGTFPWGAYLKGFSNGGTWSDKFDASIKYALKQRDLNGIPEGSWGAWWGMITYGSTYNAGAGIQCLYSEKYRTETMKNVEFQLNNQCAPYQWSEAFETKGRDQWVGMYVPRGQGGYGGYEAWGASFTKQALLQACVSVKTDGTIIIGRGIPESWLRPGDVTEWANVFINDNRKINFKITGGKAEVTLQITGDTPNGPVIFNVPALKNNIAFVSSGKADNSAGTVTLQPSEKSVTVKLIKSCN
jgi:hypothetical protein